jgi:hypothetical protein
VLALGRPEGESESVKLAWLILEQRTDTVERPSEAVRAQRA